MNIPFLSKKEKPQYFLALLLRDEKVNAVVFEELLGKVQVIGKHEEYFETSIEEASEDEWFDVLDKAISQAESTIPQNVETQKTVFGLKENWIQDSKIKKGYLAKLKKASDALGLTPLGFLITHEAIAHLMQKEEGAPVSAILVEVDKKNIAVSVFKAGRAVETKRVAVKDSIAKSCDEVLHQFTNCEILPSRIVIFDGEDVEKLSQEFISHQWSKSLSFLHVPQAVSLPKGFDAKAVLFGAATQMGFEILGEESLIPHEVEEEKQIKQTTEEKEELIKEPQINENVPLKNNVSLENFGFIKDNDVALSAFKQDEKEILENQSFQEKLEDEEQIETPKEQDYEKPYVQEKNPNLLVEKITVFFGLLTSFIKNVLKHLKNLPLPLSFGGGKKVVLIPIFMIILLFASLLLYIFGLKAEIVLSVSPKITEQTQDIIFSTESSFDPSKNIIGSELISISQDGELTNNVTGKKEVGEKAKGTITIYSRLAQEKTFALGTIIKSSNNLQFILDKAVTVASSSADASSQPSTASVAITAKDIGKESNLPSGTKFSVGSFDASDVVAKNDSAFSGGTKKEVTAVSKGDLDKLSSDLPKNIEENAKDSLLKKISNDKAVLPMFINSNFTKKEFNQKVGDEATKITLKATISFQGVSYKKSDFEEVSKRVIKENIQDMDLSEGVKSDITDIKIKNKDVLAKLHVKANLMPKIDKQKLIKDLSGKSFEDAKSALLGLPQASNIDIALKPNLPFLPNLLPKVSENITLTVESHN